MAPSNFKVLKSAGVTLQASTWRCRVFTPSEPDQRGHPSAGLNMTVTLDNRYPGSCFLFQFGPGSILFFFSPPLSLSCFSHASSLPVTEILSAASQHVIYLASLPALMSPCSFYTSSLFCLLLACNHPVITSPHKVQLISPIIIIITDQRGMIGKVREGFPSLRLHLYPG